MKNFSLARIAWSLLALATMAMAACAPQREIRYQGYIEGEFIYVSAPLAGQLEKLSVTRGARVEKGAELFVLEHAAEAAILKQAEEDMKSAQARLEDLKKGSRPTEVAAVAARLDQARSTAAVARLDFERQEALYKAQTISVSELDHSRLAFEQSTKSVEDLTAQLATAQLGGRTDAVSAAMAQVASAKAAQEHAQWGLSQKTQYAAQAALVYDTMYRQGEFVGAANPVVTLLPPEAVKVRFFVPEENFASFKAGDAIRVTINGHAPVTARVSYLFSSPEYTPPILYNRENRAKLVFMVEAVFDPQDAKDLHPGQPVDVTPVK